MKVAESNVDLRILTKSSEIAVCAHPKLKYYKNTGKLAKNWQNFMEISLAWVKILQNVLGATFFYSHCILVPDITKTCMLPKLEQTEAELYEHSENKNISK